MWIDVIESTRTLFLRLYQAFRHRPQDTETEGKIADDEKRDRRDVIPIDRARDNQYLLAR